MRIFILSLTALGVGAGAGAGAGSGVGSLPLDGVGFFESGGPADGLAGAPIQ